MCSKNNFISQNIKYINFFIFLLISNFVLAQNNYKLKTIVLDAGHGGHDSGCKGYSGKNFEKTVTLNVILEVGKLIEKKYPDITVIYTRKTDVFIPLQERAEIANKNKADVFISVHCNANPNTSASGAETFLMGLHKTDANLDVALRENSVIKLEKDYQKNYDGFDPDSPEGMIAMSLAQNANIEQSSYLAGRVQNYFTNTLNRYNRGVKQAGFWVLYRTTCPSILIETGFLSNPTEEKYLVSDKGQTELSESIFKAFEDYKTYIEKNAVQINYIEKTTKIEDKVSETQTQTIEPTQEAKTQVETITQENNTTTNIDTKNNSKEILYKVQLKASSAAIDKKNKIYSSAPYIHYEKSNGLYKYLSGPFDTFSKAVSVQKSLKEKGYTDAFIVVYQNGSRLSSTQAKQFLK
ncbi:MAG: N-acetylmuramoyl-L-alanine amidase [Sphingobacteriales bacterium]|nr:MAG: N-acetylmuramoyl-L-alanine amidase [Sphingobacteriales bacterium]